jgi:hypothetical protein
MTTTAPFRSISLLLPLRFNLPRRERLWHSLRTTLATAHPIEIVLRIDDDDTESEDWLRTALDPKPSLILRGPRLRGYRSLPKFFNQMAAASTGDLLICGNDDMTFHTPNWPAEFLAVANHYPDGIFNLGALTFPAGAFPFSCVSREVVRRLGFLNDERLLFSDIFLRDTLARFDRAIFLPHLHIKHVGATNPDIDEIKRKMAVNAAEYWALHTRCVNEAVKKLSKNP